MKTAQKIIRVEWIDSASKHNTWMLLGEFEEWAKETDSLHIVSVGFLLYESADVIVIGMSVTNDQLGLCLKIPRVAIIERVELTEWSIQPAREGEAEECSPKPFMPESKTFSVPCSEPAKAIRGINYTTTP